MQETRYDDGGVTRVRRQFFVGENEGARVAHAKRLHAQAVEDRRVIEIRQRFGIGRNKPCPCGSGKRFKKCCERRAISIH